tara:strand:- start:2316 stop:3731 length:1416 start_codon:yes stop_codon:yes gene_type:complete
MVILLKKIKFFIIHHRISIFLKLFLKNLVNLKIIKSFFIKTQIYSIGKFKLYLNPFIFEELVLIDDPKNNDIDYIQSLRNFIDKKSEFYLFNLKSNILPLFISKTLNKKVYICNKKKNFLFKNRNIVFINRKNFVKKLNLYNKKNKILITDSKDNLHIKNSKIKYIFSKNILNYFQDDYKYLYYFDKFGKINLSRKNIIQNYFLYSKSKLLNTKNHNSISAITLLKNLDIYPFDLCYESVLPYVKELIIGIDASSFSRSYSKILNTYLKQTKFKNKIKIKFFNFLSETSTDCFVRARWIADVNNKLLNEASSKYICYVQADEIFDSSLKKDFKRIVNEDRDELIINFLHFIYNFDHIRDPKYAAYNSMGRVFKKKNFISTHDGCGFRTIFNKRPNYILSNYNIFHIGYIFNYKKKISINLNKNKGIFRSSIKNFYRNLNLVKANVNDKKDIINTISRFKYLKGYKNLKKFI